MLNKIFLVGALLVPVLAYGSSPGPDLSVQIVPAASPLPPPPPPPPPPSNGIACDVGPNYAGSIPAAAQAAGFTHCAANYDFTNAAYSNPATWLDCKGASNPQWTIYGTCNSIVMAADGGVQVLDLQFNPNTDFVNGLTTTTIQTSGSNNNSNISQALFTVPTAKYVEVVARTDSNTQSNACPSGGCEMNNAWAWGGNGNPNFIEWDFIEMYAVNSGNGGIGHPWDGAGLGLSNMREPGMLSGYDSTQYHTYGFRIANDTSGNLAVCYYLDGALLDATLQGSSYPCATGSYTPSPPLGRSFLVLSSGPNEGTTNYSITGHYYVQSFRVWECSGYASGECYNNTAQVTNGGALTGSP